MDLPSVVWFLAGVSLSEISLKSSYFLVFASEIERAPTSKRKAKVFIIFCSF